MRAEEMQAVAKSAGDRIAREVCQLMLERGVKGTSRKDKREIQREIDMRKSWLSLLDRIHAAEISMDADTGIDGLFIAGTTTPEGVARGR